VALPSGSFAVPITVGGVLYTTMSASYPVSGANRYIILVRTSLYGGCGTSEAVTGVVRPFRDSADALVTSTTSPFIRVGLSTPPIDYIFALKSASVMGGGFVVPMATVGTDLRFNMYFIRTPLFVDYVVLLYSPNYATWYRTGGNNFETYPFYAVEGVSTIG
jgi:hypothetical protein